MDAAFPGQIPLNKVNFNARYDYEFSANFKILQTHFVKIKCDKVVPTDRLIKAKYQDNLEFMQWMKRWFEMEYNGAAYDAKARRKECKVEYASDKLPRKKPVETSSSADDDASAPSTAPAATTSAATTTTATAKIPASGKLPVAEGRRATMLPTTTSSSASKPQSMRLPARSNALSGSTGSAPSRTKPQTDSKADELAKRVAELSIELAKSETTRDFYYDKLREIENLLSNLAPEQESVEGLRDKINAILFSDGSS